MNESTNEYYSSNSKNENNLWKISSKSVSQPKVHIETSVRKIFRGFWRKSEERHDENSEIVVDGSIIDFRKEFLIIFISVCK